MYLDANDSGLTSPESFVNGTTHRVTATIGTHVFKAVYIYGTPTLTYNSFLRTWDRCRYIPCRTHDADKYEFTDGTAGQNAGTITATVRDEKWIAEVPDVVVKFDVVDKTRQRRFYLNSALSLMLMADRYGS